MTSQEPPHPRIATRDAWQAARETLLAHEKDLTKHYDTYSTYNRGTEALTDSYRLLDVTPYGRQANWEDSPPCWPQRPTYG